MIPHSRPWLTASDSEAVQAVLQSGQLASGRLTKKFEKTVSARVGFGEGLATASGTDALVIALRSLGIGAGDDVVIPTYVCHEVMDGVLETGATPVLADVSWNWCLTAETVEAVRTSKTRAVVIVHAFGVAADVQNLREMKLACIDDLAQAFGGDDDRGRPVGSGADVAVCSFEATKLICAGEGGMVLKNERPSPPIGRPLSDLAAALGLSQLARLDEALERRRSIAVRYRSALADSTWVLPGPSQATWFRFAVRVPEGAKGLIEEFAGRGVVVRRGVDQLLHRQFDLDGHFPVAEELFRTTVSLPIYPSMSGADVDLVSRTAREISG